MDEVMDTKQIEKEVEVYITSIRDSAREGGRFFEAVSVGRFTLNIQAGPLFDSIPKNEQKRIKDYASVEVMIFEQQRTDNWIEVTPKTDDRFKTNRWNRFFVDGKGSFVPLEELTNITYSLIVASI